MRLPMREGGEREGKKVQRVVDHAWCMTVMASVCRWGKGPNRRWRTE